jgi:hypothetical protein
VTAIRWIFWFIKALFAIVTVISLLITGAVLLFALPIPKGRVK